MRIVVNGQQAFGKAVLDALVERGEDVVAVYVASKRPGGRPDPLKEAAVAHGVAVYEPTSFKTPDIHDEMKALEPDLDASGTFEATEHFVYHTDGSGSVTELTDSTGVVARAYAYDAYGQIADEIGTLANPYAYTGREFDAESGLYFYRARYYDPETGRFLSEDPIHFAGLDVNLYRYVFNNPVNLTDPTGQILPAIIGAGCIAGAIGGVIGGFDGTVVGAITAITISEAQSGGGGGGGSSNDGCGDADSTEPPPAIPTPTPGDFLRNAAFDAFFGCVAGGIAVIGLNPATVFTAAAIASSVGVTEGFIMGFVGQIKQLF
ncbi:MAG: hypothetical protein IH903_05450 [Proteobacteria bacterium]|nr:hypothetical protein [Pseudomonadota bacterium]